MSSTDETGQQQGGLPGPGRYQAKPAGPAVVEARQVLTGNVADWPALAEWCGGVAYTEETPWDYNAGAVVMPDGHRAFVSPRDWGVIVPTPQRYKTARYGWWIIKNAKGEFGTCDPEFFAANYEAADPLAFSRAYRLITDTGGIRHLVDGAGVRYFTEEEPGSWYIAVEAGNWAAWQGIAEALAATPEPQR